MAETKKPKGLSITRKVNKYIFKWSKGETYGDGQRLYYKLSMRDGTTKKSATSSPAGTSKTVTVSTQGVKAVTFYVRGKANGKSWSDWNSETFKVYPARAPELKAEWDENLPNKTTYSFEEEAADGDHYPYDHIVWQTIRITNCPEDYRADALFMNATENTLSGTSGTIYDTAELNLSGSMTRIVRAKAVGHGGESGWVYTYHVYAKPYAPFNVKARAVFDAIKGYFDTTVSWLTNAGRMQRPIERIVIEEVVGVPTAGLGLPTGAGWNPAGTKEYAQTGQITSDSWQGSTGQALQDDECLFLRVKAEHDDQHDESPFIIAAYGELAAPTISTTPDQGQHKIAVAFTNPSQVPDANLAVVYQDPVTLKEGILGVIPNGTASPVNVTVPPWTGTVGNVGLFAFVGSYSAGAADSDGVKVYTVTAVMRSPTVWAGVPQAPTITVTRADETTATVTWSWPWEDATSAELSWADHPDAWESTEQPQTYNVENLHASQWNIKNLEIGKVWYFRARLFIGDGSSVTYGSYSKTVALDLTEAPAAPVLELSDEIITADGTTTASWQFVSTDKTTQTYAELAEVIDLGSGPVYYVIGSAQTQQQLTIDAAYVRETFPALGWTDNTQHDLALKVYSSNNKESAWSDTVTLSIAEELTCTITATSLTTETKTFDGESLTYNALKALPLTATIAGAGTTNLIAVQIIRAEDYDMERPDGKDYHGYSGQIIASPDPLTGDGTATIDLGDLLGRLDDGAQYTLIATVSDNIGQKAEDRIDFTVSWTHQAVKAAGTAVIAGDIAEITPTAPTDTPPGWALDPDDRVDIYRLSAGKPELLVEGAEIGKTYVDPFPTLGELGGYRLVFVTVNGDYITADTEPSWIDIQAGIRTLFQYIDFDGRRLELKYNVDLDMTMAKIQTVTHYLGGSIQGDTLAGTEASGSVAGVIPYDVDLDTYRQLWALGEHEGPARIRTKQGANYSALVSVQDNSTYNTPAHPHSITLNIDRIDTTETDGVLLTDWEVSA